MSLLDDNSAKMQSLQSDNRKKVSSWLKQEISPEAVGPRKAGWGVNTHSQKSISKDEKEYLRVVHVARFHLLIFVQGGKADECIQGTASYFRKAIAICRAVGAGPFARHHGSRLFAIRFFPPDSPTRVASSDAEKPGRHLEFVTDA